LKYKSKFHVLTDYFDTKTLAIENLQFGFPKFGYW
jgi:hypothetical protein